MAQISKRTNRNRNQQKPPASGQLPTTKLMTQDREAIRQALIDYAQEFGACFQRREQRQWSLLYLCGQLSNLVRKTIEPMVLGLLGPDQNIVRAVQQFIGQGQWKAQGLIECHQDLVAKSLGDPQGVVIVDGSGFPKQGQASVGVARQYCGVLGKVANCQEGVFVGYASCHGYTFLNGRLYLPEEWFDTPHRRQWLTWGLPEETQFHTEPELALEMIQDLVNRHVIPFQWLTCDEHFGQNPAFLEGIAALGKWYLAEVPRNTCVWLRTPAIEPAGRGPLGRLRLHPRVKLDAPAARELRDLGAHLPHAAWRRFTIQEGSKGPLVADFAFLRVTMIRNRLPGARAWVIFRRNLEVPPEWKFYLSNAPATCRQPQLVDLSGQRWPIETTIQEGKGEVGMDHYETRTWRGWHHHMAQTFLAHHFLMRLRQQFKKTARLDYGATAPAGRRHYG
jgi:SRSO17 transposase